MSDIKDTLDRLKQSGEELQENSDKIVDLANSVDEFSSQANLLALNAMVEVAKAGKNGKALSELAEEISILAEKSAGVASGISEIIDTVKATAKKPQDASESDH